MESEEMETFWFFWLRFSGPYDSAYDSDFRFSLGQKLSYDSDYNSDSVSSENQPWAKLEQGRLFDFQSGHYLTHSTMSHLPRDSSRAAGLPSPLSEP